MKELLKSSSFFYPKIYFRDRFGIGGIKMIVLVCLFVGLILTGIASWLVEMSCKIENRGGHKHPQGKNPKSKNPLKKSA